MGKLTNDPRFIVMAALLVTLAQLGALMFMIAGRAAILRDGPVVVLAVQPVDPRDFLRGDYVRLDYEISRIDRALLDEGASPAGSDGTLYVRLSAGQDGIWRAVRASFAPIPTDTLDDDDVVIRGQVRHDDGDDATPLLVDYGIERYYVPEGQGTAIEEPRLAERLRMHVAIGRDGAGQIKSLHDGERILHAEPLF